MAFLARCPQCGAPKRIDPSHWWEPELVECPRCAVMFQTGLRDPWTGLSWVRFVGVSPTILFALEQRREEWFDELRRDLVLDGAGDLVHAPLFFPRLVA